MMMIRNYVHRIKLKITSLLIRYKTRKLIGNRLITTALFNHFQLSLPKESSPFCSNFSCGVSQCKLSAVSRAPPLPHVIDCISCRCGMPQIGETRTLLRTRFSENYCVVCANDDSQPIARYFNSGGHLVLDIKFEPISSSNDSLRT